MIRRRLKLLSLVLIAPITQLFLCATTTATTTTSSAIGVRHCESVLQLFWPPASKITTSRHLLLCRCADTSINNNATMDPRTKSVSVLYAKDLNRTVGTACCFSN